MSKNLCTGLLRDSEKVHLDRADLFDRIINLKFKITSYKKTEKGGLSPITNEYILRSDYEVFFHNEDITKVLKGSFDTGTKTYSIRRYPRKPSIKIQYHGISKNNSVDMDIYVSNFFMFDKSGQKLMQFNMTDYKVSSIEVMMGYWGQFKNFPHDNIKDLFDFTPRFGVDRLNCKVLYVTTDKLPPDYDLHIHCYFGSILQSAMNVKNVVGSSFKSIQEAGLFTDFLSSKMPKKPMEKLLFKYVTKRYLRTDVLPKEDVKEILNTLEEGGSMSDDMADKYGVHCIVSPAVRNLEIKGLKDADGNAVSTGIFAENIGTSLGGTVLALNNEVSNVTLLTKPLLNGDIVVFTSDEVKETEGFQKIALFFSQQLEPYYKGTAAEYFDGILPAVYNITVDVITQIVCPFFFFLDLFQPVYFSSRYALGKMTTYIADFNANRMKFLPYSSTVTFATVEDVNEMQIECVTY